MQEIGLAQMKVSKRLLGSSNTVAKVPVQGGGGSWRKGRKR